MKTPNQPLRVGVAGLSHDHVWHELGCWKALPDAALVAAGEARPEPRERFTRDFPDLPIYADWREMLHAEGANLDIVQIAAPNNQHADITEACAKLGLHVITEKPMAATVEQANRMVAACEAANVRLFVNWPTQWQPAHQEMERRILAGDIGDVRYFKYRSAHNGPKEIGCSPAFYEWLYDEQQNGAGALMDYCCYGAAMCARFLGQPEKVTGLRGVFAKDYPLPDDNAIIAMQYAHAFGVAEASWTQTVGYATANPVAYGSGGSIALLGGNVVLTQPGKLPETIVPPPIVAPFRNAPEYFIHCLHGEPFSGVGAPDVSRIAQEILSAGLRAADTGQTQILTQK